MNKTVTLLVLSVFLLGNVDAQFGRNKTRNANAYRNNYQRLAMCGGGTSVFEIRGGNLWAWGGNTSGQLGDGTNTSRLTPVSLGIDNQWTTVASGQSHTLAIKSGGTLWAWGRNSDRELGDGTTTPRYSPVQVGTDNKWVSIACGTSASLAIKSDGTLWAWGYNGYGELGLGQYTTNNGPTQVGTDNKWVSIACGSLFTIGLKSDGTLWGWGLNTNGQVGDGTTTTRYTPVQIGNDNKWTTIACGDAHALAFKSDGTLWAWGLNGNGQLGDNTNTDRSAPVQIGTDNNWTSVAAGIKHTIAVKTDGTLWGWGDDTYGQLIGFGSSKSPKLLGSSSYWVSVACSRYTTLCLQYDGSIIGFGFNNYGELGDGTTLPANGSEDVRTNPQDWLQVTKGSLHTTALRSDGTLWSSGWNMYGQLGDGTTTNKSTPVQVGTATDWIAFVSGTFHNMAIKVDGTLWGWGWNAAGQVGDGTNTNRTSPTKIGAATNWVNLACGYRHTVALQSNGTLWAWGYNGYGQLGNNTVTDINAPAQIGTATNWTSIACGDYHTLALKSDGTLWAWGYNTYGQLGDGTTLDRAVPVQIVTDNKWTSVVAGSGHTLALKSDGTLWAWGYNVYGQLGDGTTTNVSVPKQIGTATNWISLSAGRGHSIALASDGGIWAWGDNINGQLGDGTTTGRLAPTRLSYGFDGIHLAKGANSSHSVLINNNRATICATGLNNYGQLGNGVTTDKSQYSCATNFCRMLTLYTGPSYTVSNFPIGLTGIQTDVQTGCVMLASITPSGAAPVAGTVTMSEYSDATLQRYNGKLYVQRHYDIAPATNATTATASVTLYYTQADFDAYNAARGNLPALPTNAYDYAGRNNVVVSQFHGTPTGGVAPQNYPATWTGTGPAHVLLHPLYVIWNEDSHRWEITVDVTGFSGFFLHTTLTNSVLPVTWLSLSGKLNPLGQASLQWAVEERDVADYTVEKSEDGLHFVGVGSVQSLGNGRNNYTFTETTSLVDRAFYRVRQTDINGRISYSKTIRLSSKKEGALMVSLYPNPVQSAASLEVHTASGGTLNYQVTDAMGQKLQSGSFVVREGVSVLTLPTRMLPQGVYLWQGNLNGQAFSLRFIKL